MITPYRPMGSPFAPVAVMASWWKNRAAKSAPKPERPSPVLPEPEQPRAAARFVLLQYALKDGATLREMLETLTRQGDTGRSDVARMLSQASRAAAQHDPAAKATVLTHTGDHLDVNTRIVNLHGMLLAMQHPPTGNDQALPAQPGDVLVVTLAATLQERRAAPTDLLGLMARLPEDALLRALICWSPAHGPLYTAQDAQHELTALADHLQD